MRRQDMDYIQQNSTYMKKRGNVCDYTSAKNAELVRVFNKRLREARVVDLDRIFAEVASSRASRFYISEERAYELVARHERTGRWDIGNTLRREMILEIHRQACRLMERDPALTMRDAVYCAVNLPAPRFYLTPRSCRTLVYATIRESYLRAAELRSRNAGSPENGGVGTGTASRSEGK